MEKTIYLKKDHIYILSTPVYKSIILCSNVKKVKDEFYYKIKELVVLRNKHHIKDVLPFEFDINNIFLRDLFLNEKNNIEELGKIKDFPQYFI